jgi:hypothetical protein
VGRLPRVESLYPNPGRPLFKRLNLLPPPPSSSFHPFLFPKVRVSRGYSVPYTKDVLQTFCKFLVAV